MRTQLTTKFFLAWVLLLGAAQWAVSQNMDKGFSFQGYARDISGAALGGKTIIVKFSIYPEGSASVFEEEHTLETDQYGVFSTVIGSVMTDDFEDIDFTDDTYFLKVETKELGGVFAEIYNTEFLAVPYAKAAGKALEADTAQVARTVIGGTMPAGTILPFAGSKANIPDGYLACDGSSLAVADYAALHAAIGDNWGGDGGTNFNLPDLRGRFMRGMDDGAGNDPDAAARTASNAGGNTGDDVGSYQDDAFQGHWHRNQDNESGSTNHGNAQKIASNFKNNNGFGKVTIRDAVSDGVHGTPRIASETRSKNVTVLYIIKY